MTTITVHGFHLDGYGHVNNARYLEFLEAARWELLAAHDDPQWWQARGYAFVIANINIDFHQPASLGDRLRVGVELGRIGDTSARLYQPIHRADDGSLVADATLVFVIIEAATGHGVSINGELRTRLENLGAALAGARDELP